MTVNSRRKGYWATSRRLGPRCFQSTQDDMSQSKRSLFTGAPSTRPRMEGKVFWKHTQDWKTATSICGIL